MITNGTTNKFSPEVRERAARMVLEDEAQHPLRWATIPTFAAEVGCTGQSLNQCVKQAKRDTGHRPGRRRRWWPGSWRENRELPKVNEILSKASAPFSQAVYDRRLKQ